MLSFSTDIVVVDSGSTDQTLKVCEAYQVKVIQHPFKGYGKQKQVGVDAATHPWIFSIDADERPNELLLDSLRNFDASKAPTYAATVARSLVFIDHKLRFGGEYQSKLIRFFHKEHASFTPALVHESIEFKGSPFHLPGELLHYSFQSLEDAVRKQWRYASLWAAEAANKGKTSTLFKAAIKGTAAWLKWLLIKGLLLDGPRGWQWAWIQAGYTFNKYRLLASLPSKRA